MKKSLVALAVLAASGVASAQSTVTLYGILDVYAGSVKAAVPGATSQGVVNSGAIQQSRFGFKGSEDLGGGLAANFVLEQGFSADTGAQGTAGQMFSRQAYVGLSGGFGEIKLGKPWTAYDDISGATQPTWDSNIFSPTNNVFNSVNYNANPGNTVYYATPNVAGFSGAASYSFGENKTATLSASKVKSFHVKYEGGPLYAGLGYQDEESQAGVSLKYTRLNASYDLGVVKLLTAYGRVKNEAAGAPTSKEWQIGADFPVSGALTISGGYARSKDEDGAVGTAAKRTGVGLAALYALSKRTNLYAGLQRAKIDAFGTANDVTGRTAAVGVRHTF